MGMKLKFGWNRRSFLAALGTLTGGMFAPSELSAAFFGKKPKPSARAIDGNPILPIKTGLGSTGDIYAELGVTPIININGTLTVIGGSVMRPEVMELIRMGNEHCVLIDDLEVAAGKFIAKLCKSPAGYTGLVTAGAAAAMVVGYAGMMTEDLEPRMRDIPDVSNFPRNEVIIQKSHRYPFDHQIRQTGAKLVEVDPRGNDCRQSTRKLWPFTLPISCPTKEKSAARRPWQSPRSTTCTPSTMPPRTCRRKSGFGNIRPWASTCSPSAEARDRKSTRLNSSHGYISYAVFCLKKKKDTERAGSPSGVSKRTTRAPRCRSSRLADVTGR